MAGPKVWDDGTSAELCVNCGMPPCKVDPTIPVTLLFSKATRQVLCLEAGKDFVDTLMGFLTLPVGCIIKLLEAASMIHRPECKLAPPPSAPLVFPPGLPYTPRPKKGKNDAGERFAMSSIANILDSVVKLNNSAMAADKNCLVDPKPSTPFGAGKLLYLHNTPRTSSSQSTQSSGGAMYYGCGNACSLYATSSAMKCPKHKKKMSVPLKLVEANVASAGDTTELGDENFQSPQGGYVKEGTKYMVTNTLEIFASSEAIKALITLHIIRAERVGDLDTMPVSVVTAEVLQLLKLSFTSTNVLNDVFGKYCADVKNVFKTRRNHSSLNAKITLAVSVLVWGLLCWRMTPHRIFPRVYPCNYAYLHSGLRPYYRSLVGPPQYLKLGMSFGDQRFERCRKNLLPEPQKAALI